MKRTLFLLLVLSFSLTCLAKTKKIHGYVTKLTSPTEFEIEDYRISRAQGFALQFEKEDKDDAGNPAEEELRVGTEVEVTGELDEATGNFQAKSLKVIVENKTRTEKSVLFQPPVLEKEGDHWKGVFFADGRRIRVEPATQVTFRPNRSEKKDKKDKEKKAKKDEAKGAVETAEPEERSLNSLAEIGANYFMDYKGVRQPDGSIIASKVIFQKAEVEPGEASLWKKLTPKIKTPQYGSGKAGEFKLEKLKYKIVPNEAVQKYVQEVGQRLIPTYLKELQDKDSNRIPFQFYVVESKVPNAFAIANGTMVIHHSMFNVLENEAQLASVMGHEIAHATQKHTWLQMQYHKKSLGALRVGSAIARGMGYGWISNIANIVESSVRASYARRLENQADRVGLEYMTAAGFDPRQAATFWKVMVKKTGDSSASFFYSDHDNSSKRRSYLMNELRANYANMDYTTTKANSEAFTNAVNSLKEMYAPKGKKGKGKKG